MLGTSAIVTIARPLDLTRDTCGAQGFTVRMDVHSGRCSVASLNSFRTSARWCTSAQDTDDGISSWTA